MRPHCRAALGAAMRNRSDRRGISAYSPPVHASVARVRSQHRTASAQEHDSGRRSIAPESTDRLPLPHTLPGSRQSMRDRGASARASRSKPFRGLPFRGTTRCRMIPRCRALQTRSFRPSMPGSRGSSSAVTPVARALPPSCIRLLTVVLEQITFVRGESRH